MDEARIREQIAQSERVEIDGSHLRELHRLLSLAVADHRIRKGERSGEPLRTEAECWGLVETVFQNLDEGVRVMDEAVEKAVEIVKARGPCEDPECPSCHPDTPVTH